MSDAPAIRAWARRQGIPCPSRGVIPGHVRREYTATHPVALESSPAGAATVPPPAGEPNEPGETLVTVTTWHEGWEGPIAQAIADLIATVEASTRDRVLTELRAHLGAGA